MRLPPRAQCVGARDVFLRAHSGERSLSAFGAVLPSRAGEASRMTHCGSRPSKFFALRNSYSITSSARSKIDCGTVSPSTLAVLRFTTISNFVGNCTGRSPGFAPRRMRST
jgi:hypothetical protein